MEPAARRSGGVWEGLYRVIMRRTPIYVTFVVVGAFLGERIVVLFSYCNKFAFLELQKRYEDIPVLGQRQSEE
ncbi:hypothetical protein DH2020_000414 [Rehmannia glutinosa]|uniref:Complex III subunit 9 n=1 Tax=Rehmannia glutinosa TaxID=99300 RepID=A0ABR0XX39_REHGL